MAVSASGIERGFQLFRISTACPMAGMALQAEKRHLDRQKVVVDRAMRTMARPAVIRIIRMLENKRAFFITVALHARVLHGRLSQKLFCRGSVRIMAVSAEDLLFGHRMVARERELGPCLLVASGAHIEGVSRLHLEV